MKKFLFLFFLPLLAANIFSATMDPRVRSVPKSAQELVFENPKEGLPLVVKSLTGGGANKVKALHDWICDNIAYDTELYFNGGPARQDYESVLKKRKALCSGYTNLMTVMCRMAGIEAIGIEGFSKGFGYQGKCGDETDHAWNAVKIGGKWQLIDVTWDAGYVDYRTFIKRYSTEWLNRTPEQFIFSHLPEKDEFQYLKKTKTREEFEKEPYIAGIFFEYGLSLGNPAPDYTNEVSGAAKYEFRTGKAGVSLMTDLIDTEGGRLVENATWIERIGNRATADFDIPTAKKHKARLLARNANEKKAPDFFSAAEFEGRILPEAQNLVEQKKATQKEFDFLRDSYFPVEENRRYYRADDPFSTQRNNAVLKILEMLKKTSQYEEVISVDLVPASGYEGFGAETARFPTPYGTFHETSNTHLISPTGGVLKKGAAQKFQIESKDFKALGVVIDGKLTKLSKNQNGIFEAEIEIPENIDTLSVYGSRNEKSYSGLWLYRVE